MSFENLALIHLISIEIKPGPKKMEGFPFGLPLVQKIQEGELHLCSPYLAGKNGSGKSTLLKAVAVGVGSVAVGGEDTLRDQTLRRMEIMWSAKRASVIATGIFLYFLTGTAQTPDRVAEGFLVLGQGVAPHKGLDDIYRRFSEAYKKLDAALVAGLYSGTAVYLAPESNIQIGRQEVSKIFTGFFDSVRQRNGRLEISFRIVQRQVDRNLAYDVGIYTLTSFNEKGEPSKDSGKFVVVAKRERGDVWRFQVDGYSAMPKEPAADIDPDDR